MALGLSLCVNPVILPLISCYNYLGLTNSVNVQFSHATHTYMGMLNLIKIVSTYTYLQLSSDTLKPKTTSNLCGICDLLLYGRHLNDKELGFNGLSCPKSTANDRAFYILILWGLYIFRVWERVAIFLSRKCHRKYFMYV